LLSYGLVDPVLEERNYVLPIFGQTGVSSSFTTGTFNSYGPMTTYSGTTTYTPQYGITGYAPVSSKIVKYPKYIVLSAYEAEPGKRVKDLTKLWETKIYCDNGIDDLRRSFAVMVAAAQNYIGTNTRHEIDVALFEEDPAVTSLYSKRKSEKSEISPDDNGKAIPIEEVEASATNGDVYSQTLLGVTNFNRKNFGESFKWFEMAAAQGDCLAQYFLAVSYESGLGTSSNPEKSFSWALKAAEQGLVEAQHYVAMEYFLANKHPMDMVHAYAWAFTAYMNGDDEASKVVHMAKDKMSSEQIEAALQEHYSIMKTDGFNDSSDKYKCTTYR
ncbi:MAG: tetratricopeptide repeat protein, partial [Syntrophorhabdus sp.]